MIACLCFSIIIIITDMVMKYLMEKSNKLPKNICHGRVRLQVYHNKGAFWNVGESNPKLIRILSVSMTAALFLVLLISFGQKGNVLLKIGLSALFGGAFGNTYDRLKRKYVVDYVSFPCKIKKLSNTIFNISDFFIMIGALFCCLAALKK